MSYREVERVYRGENKREGAGVRVKRIFDREDVLDLDPFLMLDFFDMKDYEDYKGGFPWHPHRGLETITYMLAGEVYHEDTLKNKGSITGGECQWMVSGNGIMHQELMVESDYMLGVQIWLNMPAEKKMKNPSYMDIRKKDLTLIDGGNRIRLLAGEYEGLKGPVSRKDGIDPRIIDLELEANKNFIFEEDRERTVFVFVLEGSLKLEEEEVSKGEGVLYRKNTGDKIGLKAGEQARLLILSAYPIEEPIAWEGPIVMNTSEELDRAFDELNKHEFIKYRG